MPRLNEDAESHMTNGRTIWRYISADTFFRILNSESIFLPTAINYEDTDLNEGRFTDTYVKVVRNWVSQYEHPETSEDEEIAMHLSKLLAAREVSYISCWTVRDYEDEQMWETFGDGKRGVALKSTIGKICDEFYDHCDENEPVDLTMGLIEYDRMNMHKHISAETIFDYHLPLFFLDGGQRSFIHEREFRFIIYDPAEVDDLSSDILTADEVVLGGTIQLSKKYRERISSNLGKGISVPINLENFLLEIHFGSAMDAGTKDKIRKKLMELQLTITCHESEV
jgi:hypothetical protein